MSNLRPAPPQLTAAKVSALLTELDLLEDGEILSRLKFTAQEAKALRRVAREQGMKLPLLLRVLVCGALEAMGERLD